MTKTFMTIENIEEIAMLYAFKIQHGKGWVSYYFLRANANGVKFYYDVTIYHDTEIDVWRKNITKDTSKGYSTWLA